MRKIVSIVIIAAVILSCSSAVWALAQETTNLPIVQQPHWPKGLSDILASQKPTYAYWVNSADFFLYSGDAREFNAFIEHYLKVVDTTCQVVLHPGQGKQRRITDETYVAFDWRVSIAPTDAHPADNKRHVTVNLYLGGNIDWDEVRMPDSIKLEDRRSTTAPGTANRRVPPDPAPRSDWPEGLEKLLASLPVVDSYTGASTERFLYTGDSSAFNTFLEGYAGLEGTPLTLVLHTHTGKIADLKSREKGLPFDWFVLIMPPTIPDGGIDKSSPYKTIVTVHVYLGGNVSLNQMSVPLGIKVVSGQEIDKFVERHEAERNRPTGTEKRTST